MYIINYKYENKWAVLMPESKPYECSEKELREIVLALYKENNIKELNVVKI